jgi:hypothetical protein
MGTKHSEWGDCYRAILQVAPEFLNCFHADEYGLMTELFRVPFDPHDVKYWRNNKEFMMYYNNLPKLRMPSGVRVETVEEDDVIYDYRDGEYIDKVKLHFIQTNKDYECRGDHEDE